MSQYSRELAHTTLGTKRPLCLSRALHNGLLLIKKPVYRPAFALFVEKYRSL